MRSHSVTVPFTNSASRRRKFLNEMEREVEEKRLLGERDAVRARVRERDEGE
jgi:hypothetical protein